MTSTDQRPGGQRLTASDSPEFAALWRETAHRLTVFLRRLGASRELADDLVQDVAVKLLRAEPDFEEPKDLIKWSYVVARNLYIDHVRRPGPLACDPDELPEAAAQADVARTVEARLALSQAGRLMRTMNASDRAALLQLVQDEPALTPASRSESTRLAVQRHRARNRLQELITGTAAVLGVLWAKFRPLGSQATVATAYVTPLLALAMVPLLTREDVQMPLVSRPAVVVQQTDAPTDLGVENRPTTGPGVVRAAIRPANDGGARAPREDVRVDTPVPGLRARSGTTANPDNHLVCVGLGLGRPDVCVDKPPVPSD